MALSSAGTDRNADLRDTRRSQTVAVTYQTPHPPGPSWPGQPPRRPGLWNRLSPLQRAGLIATILVLPCCGGLTALGALTGDRSTETVTTSEQLTDRQQAAANATDPAAATDATATATATATASATATATAPEGHHGARRQQLDGLVLEHGVSPTCRRTWVWSPAEGVEAHFLDAPLHLLQPP